MPASWRIWISLAALLLGACAAPPGSGPATGPARPDGGDLPRPEAAVGPAAAEPEPEVDAEALRLQETFAAALARAAAGDWPAAESGFRGLTRDKPNLQSPWVNLGVALAHQGRDEQALAVLRHAVTLDPGNARAQHEAGILLRRTGHFDEARGAYEAALAADPQLALAHRNLGLLCDLYLHDLSCALRHYQAYQGLLSEADPEVDLWILDLQRRIDGR